MTRSMIAANKAVFDKFRKRYSRFGSDAVKRYVVSDELDKHWLQNVEFETPAELVFSDVQSVHLCRINDEVFLLTKNIEWFVDSSLTLVPVNGGLFVAAAMELPINLKMGLTEDQVAEVPMRELADDEAAIGFEFHEIIGYFDELRLYRVPADSQLLRSDYALRIALLFVLNPSTQLCRLKLRSASIAQFGRTLGDDVENFPLALVYQATQERRWDIAFLNIYKSLEQLFPLFKVEDFREGYNEHLATMGAEAFEVDQVKLFDLASLAENHLGWRAHEEDAMQRLFSKLSEDLIDEFCCYLGVDQDDLDRKIRKVSESIYRIRNCTVHFRPGNIVMQRKIFPVDEDYWESILCTLLKSTIELYRRYGGELR